MEKKNKFRLTREGNKASRWRLDCYRKIIKPGHPIRFHQRREMESLRKARRMCLWLASRVFKTLDIDWGWTLSSQRWGIPGGERTLQAESNVGSVSRVQKSLVLVAPHVISLNSIALRTKPTCPWSLVIDWDLWCFLPASIIHHFLVIALLPSRQGRKRVGEGSLSFQVFLIPKTVGTREKLWV